MARRGFKDYQKGTTAPGVLVFPKISAPDFRFEAEFGEFNCLLDLEGAPAADLVKLIDSTFETEYGFECEEKGKVSVDEDGNTVYGLKKYDGRPYGPATDKDKEVIPGVTRFRFKRKAGGRMGPKSKSPGKIWGCEIPIFGASGDIPVTEEVWGGSKAIVAFQLQPWWTASLGFGIKLSIEAVQILELVSSNGARTATAFGFESTEGYQPTVATPETVNETLESEEDTSAEGGVEF
jgi:hypothetical protein